MRVLFQMAPSFLFENDPQRNLSQLCLILKPNLYDFLFKIRDINLFNRIV